MRYIVCKLNGEHIFRSDVLDDSIIQLKEFGESDYYKNPFARNRNADSSGPVRGHIQRVGYYVHKEVVLIDTQHTASKDLPLISKYQRKVRERKIDSLI